MRTMDVVAVSRRPLRYLSSFFKAAAASPGDSRCAPPYFTVRTKHVVDPLLLFPLAYGPAISNSLQYLKGECFKATRPARRHKTGRHLADGPRRPHRHHIRHRHGHRHLRAQQLLGRKGRSPLLYKKRDLPQCTVRTGCTDTDTNRTLPGVFQSLVTPDHSPGRNDLLGLPGKCPHE